MANRTEHFQTGMKWDPEKVRAGRAAGQIKTHLDYPPEHGVPITQAEAYERSRRFGEPDDDE